MALIWMGSDSSYWVELHCTRRKCVGVDVEMDTVAKSISSALGSAAELRPRE